MTLLFAYNFAKRKIIYIYIGFKEERREKENQKGLPVGPDTCLSSLHVSLDRYFQDAAYTFTLCRNEVNRGVCQALLVEL